MMNPNLDPASTLVSAAEKELEKVLGEALRRQAYDCVLNTGSKGEQIDIVVECQPAFYVGGRLAAKGNG